MAIRKVETRPKTPLSAEQKVAFALLMFLGFGGVVLGFKSFGANLMRPIQTQISTLYTGETFLTSDAREAKALEESKTKDTDADGLVDYDELYVYKTSPYVADTDSDGFDDKTEIFSGNDPNCPVGKDCGAFIASSEEANTSDAAVADLFEGLSEKEVLEAGSISFESPEQVEAFFKQATISEIRAALLESGMSQEELDAIDDETLEAYFYGALDDASETGAFDSLVNGNE
jgi:hypothetical protein